MAGYIPAVLSALAMISFVNALIPADPTITAPAVLPKRQNDNNFIGWLEYSGTWYSETCNTGLTWYQDTKYAQCCPVSLASCYAPTACVSGSLIYPYSDKSTTRTIACTENFGNTKYSICNTAFIFENTADSNPKTDIICGDSSINWSYYRKIPASATQPVASSVAPNSIPQIVSTAAVGPQATSSSKSGGSKAWIAGAVVGPIVGLALIGAAVFFFLRSRKNKNAHQAPQQGGAAMSSTDPTHAPAGVSGFTDTKPQFANNNQSAFAAQQNTYSPQHPQQGFQEGPQSPVPQYTPAPYTAPGSPPPQQQAFQNDVKYGYAAPPANGAVEIGGETSAVAPSATHATEKAPVAAPSPQVAELGGESSHTAPGQGQGLFGSSELAATQTNPTTKN